MARTVWTPILAAATIALSSPAWPAGESGGSGGGGGGGGGASPFLVPAPAPAAPAAAAPDGKPRKKQSNRGTPICSAGYALQKGSCVRVRAGIMPDEELYVQGHALAKAGFHAEALPILDAIETQSNAMVWTMRGYATRKLGRIDEGMALYRRALAIDPANLNTHEYLGEAYLTLGDQDRARAELATLERLGGRDTEQYRDLAEAIETGLEEDDD